MEHFVYALIKNEKPIYVGCTSNIKNRIKNHKATKDFDTYVIIEKFENKNDALICERGIIHFKINKTKWKSKEFVLQCYR